MAGQKQSQPPTDRRVGLNPTGRPRRSSAPSRRKQARRLQTVPAPDTTQPDTTPEEAS